MDIEHEEMQFLGFLGCFKQSFKMIYSWRKIFIQITLTLILPLSFIFLTDKEVSNLFSKKIRHTKEEMHETLDAETSKYEKLYHILSSEFIKLLLFKFAYYTFLLIFSLLSTSAIVYTTASIYTAKFDLISFKKVMSVVPKVWKRLMLTFLCAFGAFFIYNFITFCVIVILIVTTEGTNDIYEVKSVGGIVRYVLVMILYCIGSVYLTLIWQLASVMSVLENLSAIKAIKKCLVLIKGKMGLSFFIFFSLNVCFVLIRLLFEVVVVDGSWTFGYVDRTIYGILILLMLSCFFLFGLVLQTVLYFVCKSYHHESIDKSALASHLEVYLGDYVPLNDNRVVELQQYRD